MKKNWDWNNFLNKKKITEEEWDIAMDKSSAWVTCACGEQCISIPRDARGAPRDQRLRKLGSDFAICIMIEDRHGAKKIPKQIEERASELIEYLNK